jgi:RecB family endonuclease NucS
MGALRKLLSKILPAAGGSADAPPANPCDERALPMITLPNQEASPRGLPMLRPYKSERDLQAKLRVDIEMLEPGLTIIDGGRELIVPSGRVDITAQDREGTRVVIELKFGRADRYAVAQLLSYMGDLAVDGTAVRGILVAEDFDWGARSVARAAAAPIKLKRYKNDFSYSFLSA